jgi:hypothetical protein
LPTSIKKTNEVLTNFSNLVSMKEHERTPSSCISEHTSVVFSPVFVVTNSIVHLLFDLTHGVSFVVDLASMGQDEVEVKGWWTAT